MTVTVVRSVIQPKAARLYVSDLLLFTLGCACGFAELVALQNHAIEAASYPETPSPWLHHAGLLVMGR